MKNIEDKVTEAKAEIESARLNLLDAYLTKIRDTYATLPPHQKNDFLSSLERIALMLNHNSNLGCSEKLLPGLLQYDPIKAKELRTSAGLSREDLGRILASKSIYRMVSKYESGEVCPKPTMKLGRKYLVWLKEQGYNPYNL